MISRALPSIHDGRPLAWHQRLPGSQVVGCIRRSVLFGLALLSCGLAEAEVYKWVDENGRVHYGDRPRGDTAEELDVRSAPTTPAPDRSPDRARRMLQIFEEDRQRKKQQAAERQRVEAERAQSCAYARARLKRYVSARYLYDTDAQGHERSLSSEQRSEAEAKARQAVDHWCGRGGRDIQP